jgi:glycosyltransferase involved in cell wall biosynthesis
MRILILTQYFPPEIGGAPTRLQSFAAELKNLGHAVEVVTALPNYPRGRFFPGYEGAFYRRELRNGIVTHRLWVYPALGGGFARLLNYLSFTLTSFLGFFRCAKPDCIFVESPPIFLSMTAYIAGLFWRAPFIFNVADLWPDIVVEGGFLKPGLILNLLYALERWSYSKAAVVSVVTEGIRDTLLRKKSVRPEKLVLLPNGVDTALYSPRPADESFKRSLGLAGKKVILWAGTIGHAHGLEHVLCAAQLLESYPEIHFLFVGDGSARPHVEKLSAEMKLPNVSFRDPVPLEQLPPYFSIAEIGLSSLLNIPLYDSARPSKFFPILASGKPLVFAGRGEAARLLEDAGAGVVVPPENPKALAEAIVQLLDNPEALRRLGQNGHRFVVANLQWSNLVGDWIRQVSQLPATAKFRFANTVAANSVDPVEG